MYRGIQIVELLGSELLARPGLKVLDDHRQSLAVHHRSRCGLFAFAQAIGRRSGCIINDHPLTDGAQDVVRWHPGRGCAANNGLKNKRTQVRWNPSLNGSNGELRIRRIASSSTIFHDFHEGGTHAERPPDSSEYWCSCQPSGTPNGGVAAYGADVAVGKRRTSPALMAWNTLSMSRVDTAKPIPSNSPASPRSTATLTPMTSPVY